MLLIQIRSQATAKIVARTLALSLFIGLFACAGANAVPPVGALDRYPAGTTVTGLRTVDSATGGPCSVSVDGLVWYALASGPLPAIDFTQVDCKAPAAIAADVPPPMPTWAHPTGPTQALFVATSFQEAYSVPGTNAIHRLAASAGIPITWMIGNPLYLDDAGTYDALHTADGDDVELGPRASLYVTAKASLPWFVPTVSADGAGRERVLALDRSFGNRGFWGITWNSRGTDTTSDLGAPWGTYCADPTAYKRPDPSGACDVVAFEWTARDLTRAYFADTSSRGYSAEAAFSTDPDDIVRRAGFDPNAGATYARRLVDAYAAAGMTQPIVMMSQQESADEATMGAADDVVLGALYRQAVADAMKPVTLAQALPLAKLFSARPRAIAFPYIPGGEITPYDGVPFTPATIDYHDDVAGMTFVAGHTLPARIVPYARETVSTFDRALVTIGPGDPDYPRITASAFANGRLTFTFVTGAPTHVGVALWSDPSTLALSGPNVVPAGRAGDVVTFDLPAGTSTQSVPCGGCTSTTLPYAI